MTEINFFRSTKYASEYLHIDYSGNYHLPLFKYSCSCVSNATKIAPDSVSWSIVLIWALLLQYPLHPAGNTLLIHVSSTTLSPLSSAVTLAYHLKSGTTTHKLQTASRLHSDLNGILNFCHLTSTTTSAASFISNTQLELFFFLTLTFFSTPLAISSRVNVP